MLKFNLIIINYEYKPKLNMFIKCLFFLISKYIPNVQNKVTLKKKCKY